MVGIHLQFMADDCRVNAGHFIGCPGKDRLILFEEVEQLRLLGLGELASHEKESVRVGGINIDLGEVFDAFLCRSPADVPELGFSIQFGHIDLGRLSFVRQHGQQTLPSHALVASDSDHLSSARPIFQRELEFLMAGGGHRLHAMQPCPPYYDIVRGRDIDY
ncbi:hypothetical protein AAC387_Pa02g1688 [Persea americana]